MSETTARLGLPLLAQGQAQKEVTHNEALALLDSAAQAWSLEAVARNQPPGDPDEGQAWLVGGAPSGAWQGHGQEIALWVSGWRFVAVSEGMLAFDRERAMLLLYHGGAWTPLPLAGGLDPWLALPGEAGSYAATPASAALHITGDGLVLRVRLSKDPWETGDNEFIAGRRSSTGEMAWHLRKSDIDRLAFQVTADGLLGNAEYYDGGHIADVPGLADGEAIWLAVVLRLDDGEGSSLASFHASPDGETWTQFRSESGPLLAAIHDTTAPLELGSHSDGASGLFTGRIHELRLYDGIGDDHLGGELVAQFRAADAGMYLGAGSDFESAATGETWTLHGRARIANALQALVGVESSGQHEETVSSDPPSGGSDGDAWDQVEE